MSATTVQSEWFGHSAVTLSSDLLEAVMVPGLGGNLLALRDRRANTEILRTPPSLQAFKTSPAVYGTPVLFPPNRIEDGTFQFNGKTYHWPLTEPKRHNHIHGFVHTRPWTLRRHEVIDGRAEVDIEFASTSFPDVLEVYPHPFRIGITYAIDADRLIQTVRVANEDDEPMPWGLGFHTTFNIPLQSEAAPKSAEVKVSLDKRWVLNERFLPTAAFEPVSNADGWEHGWCISGHALDDAFVAKAVATDTGTGQLAVITDHGARTRITYRCDERYGHWVIYNADGAQRFVSLEPYTWITNAPNLALPPEVTGFSVLAPGASVTLASEIVIEQF